MDRSLRWSWIEVRAAALEHNVRVFRRLIGPGRLLGVVVKGNAYGHGMIPVARAVLAAGADWLDVFGIEEAFALRAAGITAPILVLGPTRPDDLARAAGEDVCVTVADPVAAASARALETGLLRVHLKLETGTHRQGLQAGDFGVLAALAAAPHVRIEGAYTHFADIEDTTDHRFALSQLASFEQQLAELARSGIRPAIRHTACTAALLLLPATHFEMARVGIGAYGLWPSRETRVSLRERASEALELAPVMAWKTRVTQVKAVAAGASVGYGRTYKTTRASRLAVLPVGYANGYDRHLSNRAHVLVRGQRAAVRGRVMMNMTLVDVTDVEGASVGDEVVLLGAQGAESISADDLAAWQGTINYEVVTRVDPFAARILV